MEGGEEQDDGSENKTENGKSVRGTTDSKDKERTGHNGTKVYTDKTAVETVKQDESSH